MRSAVLAAASVMFCITAVASIFEWCDRRPDGESSRSDTCRLYYGRCIGDCVKYERYNIGDCRSNGVYCNQE